MLFLLLACHQKDDSAEQPLDLAVHDCTPVDQYSPSGKSAPSGYEYCALGASGGFMHRVEAVDVADDPFRNPDAICFDHVLPNYCKTDADCEKGSVCEDGGKTGGCRCHAKCRADADCGEEQACLPQMLPLGGHERVLSGDNYCITATCLTDADCRSGWCVLSSGCSEPIGGQLHCFSSTDECRTSADCSDAKDCYHGMDGSFECNYYGTCE